jgi:hypothetical protein
MTTKPYEGHLLSDTETADKTVGTITIDEENQDNEDK